MKRAGTTCLVLAVLSTAACGGGSDTGSGSAGGDKTSSPESGSVAAGPVKGDVVVKESGYFGDHLFASVENREDREISIDLTFTAYNASNGTVDISDIGGTGVSVLPPKSTIFIARGAGKGGIVRATADPRATDSEIPQHGNGGFEASEVTLDLSSVPRTARATIKNTYPQSVESGSATLLCKNSKGEMAALDVGQFNAPANGSGEATFSVDRRADDVQTCQAFPHIAGYTKFGS